MKLIYLLIPLLISCLPQTPKDVSVIDSSVSTPTVIDPLAKDAWHLENRGQSSFSYAFAIAGEDSKIHEVHALGITGKRVRIAVSDDGLDKDHPDLKNNELAGEHRNYTLPSPYIGAPTPLTSQDAHGTAVTGLIAAIKGNTIGSFGVAPDAKFAGFQYLNSSQTEALFFDQLKGNFDIFNYSYGSRGCIITDLYSANYRTLLFKGVTERRNQLGSIYIKAAGNAFQDTLTRCGASGAGNQKYWGNANFEAEQTLPYIMVVGAINARGARASYSTPGANLWISAAGGEDGVKAPAMITTDLQGCSKGWSSTTYASSLFEKGDHAYNKNCDYVHTMNGTSSATPVVSGVVALLLEANPLLSWRDIKHIIAKTADRVDFNSNNLMIHPQSNLNLAGHIYDQKWTQNQAKNYFSNWYGFGRINAKAAVEMAQNNYTPLSAYIEEVAQTVILNPPLTIPSGNNNNAAGISDTLNYSSPINKIESVELEVELEHHFIGDLGIELTSPGGTVSRLTLINSWGLDYLKGNNLASQRKLQLLSNAFYEEGSTGPWTIKVIDGSSDNTQEGLLKSWSLKIHGRAN